MYTYFLVEKACMFLVLYLVAATEGSMMLNYQNRGKLGDFLLSVDEYVAS